MFIIGIQYCIGFKIVLMLVGQNLCERVDVFIGRRTAEVPTLAWIYYYLWHFRVFLYIFNSVGFDLLEFSYLM